MRHVLALTLLAVLPTVSFSHDQSEKVKALVEEGKKLKQQQVEQWTGRLDQAKEELALAEKGIISPSQRTGIRTENNKKWYVFRSRQEKDKRIEELQADIKTATGELAKLDKIKLVMPKIDVDKLEVGSIGLVVYPVNVVNVGNEPVRLEILQVIDENSMLVRTYGSHVFWVRMNTKGLVDGKKFILDSMIEVVGTKTYKTTDGASKTVFELVPVKLPE